MTAATLAGRGALSVVLPGVPESVRGGARGLPALAGRPPDEHGRGLRIVAAVAAGWGTEPAEGGRVAWCRIEAPQVPAARDGRRS